MAFVAPGRADFGRAFETLGSRRVKPLRRGLISAMLASRISRSTWTLSRLSTACTRGEPWIPPGSAWISLIYMTAALDASLPRHRHLLDQAREMTPRDSCEQPLRQHRPIDHDRHSRTMPPTRHDALPAITHQLVTLVDVMLGLLSESRGCASNIFAMYLTRILCLWEDLQSSGTGPGLGLPCGPRPVPACASRRHNRAVRVHQAAPPRPHRKDLHCAPRRLAETPKVNTAPKAPGPPEETELNR